jgi:ATP-dependent RNA helicase DDX10/DBP4
MLFSATLSKSIHQLKALSLKSPEVILLHEKGNEEVGNYDAPIRLAQYYMVLSVNDKVDVLFSFLKAHLK